ncbi:hypothetical protein J5N97_026669 [Dioscorea zingiberensis]|uniref:Uncharacterized protein n=1 Tax=Dioscorea zingiberensis TaxID=325984 RepID=A0A9D5C2P3_9LILI|nr:hypothetical protein J5N97_026669 [Dioscorea zingiberensis]
MGQISRGFFDAFPRLLRLTSRLRSAALPHLETSPRLVFALLESLLQLHLLGIRLAISSVTQEQPAQVII